MKICLALMLTGLCTVATAPAIAGTDTGFVEDISVRDSDGLIVVNLLFELPRPFNHPACAVRPYWIIPDEASDSGKRLFKILLAAHVAGHRVTIRGKNTCSRVPDGEDIEDVNVIEYRAKATRGVSNARLSKLEDLPVDGGRDRGRAVLGHRVRDIGAAARGGQSDDQGGHNRCRNPG
jgi:hypothetical protein